MIIREATQDDRPALEARFRELQAFERTIEPNRADPDAICGQYIDDLFRDCEKASGAIFVAEADGAIVGFICILLRVAADVIERDPEYAYITDLIVRESHRQTGVGTQLMRAVENYASEQGATRIRVGVLAANGSAHRFYKALGYADNEIVLEKRTSPASSRSD